MWSCLEAAEGIYELVHAGIFSPMPMIKLATLQCSSICPSVSVYSLYSVCSPWLYLLRRMCIYMYAYQVGGVGGDWGCAIRVMTLLMTDQKRRSLSKLCTSWLADRGPPSSLLKASCLTWVTKGPEHLTHPLVCLLSVFLQIYSFKKGGQTRNLPRTASRNLLVSELICLGWFFSWKSEPCHAQQVGPLLCKCLVGGKTETCVMFAFKEFSV